MSLWTKVISISSCLPSQDYGNKWSRRRRKKRVVDHTRCCWFFVVLKKNCRLWVWSANNHRRHTIDFFYFNFSGGVHVKQRDFCGYQSKTCKAHTLCILTTKKSKSWCDFHECFITIFWTVWIFFRRLMLLPYKQSFHACFLLSGSAPLDDQSNIRRLLKWCQEPRKAESKLLLLCGLEHADHLHRPSGNLWPISICENCSYFFCQHALVVVWLLLRLTFDAVKKFFKGPQQ